MDIFLSILSNFGKSWTICVNFEQFLAFFGNFWTFQYYCARLPQQPYFPHCARHIVHLPKIIELLNETFSQWLNRSKWDIQNSYGNLNVAFLFLFIWPCIQTNKLHIMETWISRKKLVKFKYFYRRPNKFTHPVSKVLQWLAW